MTTFKAIVKIVGIIVAYMGAMSVAATLLFVTGNLLFARHDCHGYVVNDVNDMFVFACIEDHSEVQSEEVDTSVDIYTDDMCLSVEQARHISDIRMAELRDRAFGLDR